MKQTAIDWLKKELEDYGSSSHLNLDWTTFDQLCEQAKQMEKEQMIEFAQEVAHHVLNEDWQNPYPFSTTEHYNETYNK